MRHASFIATAIALSLLGGVAHADSVSEPPQEWIELLPSGPVAQGTLLVAQSEELIVGVVLEVVDSSGERTPLQRVDRVDMTRRGSISPERWAFEPPQPLEPGDYTLRLVEGFSYSSRSDLEVDFTVTDELPPNASIPPPSLSWRAVGFAPKPGASNGRSLYGHESGYIAHRSILDASPGAPGTPGHIEVTLLDEEARTIYRVATPLSASPDMSWAISFLNDESFVACVSATSYDTFGRASEPTVACNPDKCVARYSGDNWDIDWARVEGCEDWSPGYAERHAEGCACAQSSGAPTGSPVALMLFVFGLAGARLRAARSLRMY